MEILVRIETVKSRILPKIKGHGNELVMDVKARRLLDPIPKGSYIADDGNKIVREFVIELEDSSNEDIKEFEGD